jgi:hypothetical protein
MTKIGGNRWNEFVKDFAKRNNTTYGCSISMPECKAEYKEKYPKPVKGKRGRPKKKLDDNFGLAPENVSKEPIKLVIQELEEGKPPTEPVSKGITIKSKATLNKKLDDLEESIKKIKTKKTANEALRIRNPLVKERNDMNKAQRTRFNKLDKLLADMKGTYKFELLEEALPSTEPKSKGITIKKKAPYEPLEEAKEPVSKGIKIKESVPRPKASEVEKLMKDLTTILDEHTDAEYLKKNAKPILKKLVGFYNDNLLNTTDDKRVTSLGNKYNAIIKEHKATGKGRMNRIKLKRMRGGKENHSYAEETEEGGTRTEVISNCLNALNPLNCIRRTRRGRQVGIEGSTAPLTAENVSAISPAVTQEQRNRMALQLARRTIADDKKKKQDEIKRKNFKVVPEDEADLGQIDFDEISSSGTGRGRGRPRKGGNVITDLASKGKQILTKIGNKYLGERLPPNFKKILDKYGNSQIISLTLGRTPVPSYINTALNVVSLGEWKKRFASQPYDKLYHLYLIITTSSGRFLIEKNERLNASTTIPQGEQLEIAGNFSGLTPNILLEKTEKLMGTDFYNYSASSNNCQHFIMSVMKANNIGSPKDYEFVKQDTEKIFQGLNSLKKVADYTTGIGAIANKIYQGGRVRGRPRGGGTAFSNQSEFSITLQVFLGLFGSVFGVAFVAANYDGLVTIYNRLFPNRIAPAPFEEEKDADIDGAGIGAGFFETRLRQEADKAVSLTPEERTELYEMALAIAHSNPANPNPHSLERGAFNINAADKNRGKTVTSVMNEARAMWNKKYEAMEGLGRPSVELKHELRNYNDILGHLSSHLLSNEKQDPKDARDALRYAKELVRVLEQFGDMEGGSRIGDFIRRVTGQDARVVPDLPPPQPTRMPVAVPIEPPNSGLSRRSILKIRRKFPITGRLLPGDYFGTAQEIQEEEDEETEMRRMKREDKKNSSSSSSSDSD